MASRVGKYLLLETLGTGSFGKVKLGVHEDSGERVAVKIMDKGAIKQHEMATNVRREIAIMKALEHRNIVNLRQVLTSANKLYIVMDLVTGGELFTKIYKHGALPEPLARKYFQELVDGVSYCHSKGVYHRDLKPENLLIDEATGSLKITDFGLSTMVGVHTTEEMLHTMCGSPNYCAPEIIARSKTGYSGSKVDAWACGIVLFALLTGYLPFYDDNQKTLYRMIATQPVRYPSNIPDDAKDLINKLLAKDPNGRLTVQEVKEHFWFQRGYVDVKATIRAAVAEPRTYHFKAAAARSTKDLKIRTVPPSNRLDRALQVYNQTATGERLQRIDDVLQRYRLVFELKADSMLLKPEMKRREDVKVDASIRALAVAEAVAVALKQQLVAALDGEKTKLAVSDKELASFEELVGIFGAHATSTTSQWWRKVGVSIEEQKRVVALTATLDPPPKRQAATGPAKESASPNAAARPREKPDAMKATSGAPATKPTAVATAAKPSPVTAAPAGSNSFVSELPAERCISIVGRILASKSFHVMMKRNENKLKCEVPCRNGLTMLVSISAVSHDGKTLVQLKRGRGSKSKSDDELLSFVRVVSNEFRERAKQKDLPSAGGQRRGSARPARPAAPPAASGRATASGGSPTGSAPHPTVARPTKPLPLTRAQQQASG